ncbi:HIT domain-containing protein [Patescibacteria group bacterium]|nr:HIT domain-containing protein [Patescibacteria group bacterium]
MEKDYSQYLIKEYQFWSVYTHESQQYLGRCAIVCKRADALDLAEATKEEQAELFVILADLRKALSHCFQPDWFNYAFLGNEFRHLHGHLIPRYASKRTVFETTFEDTMYGQHYQLDYSRPISEEILQKIKNLLVETLASLENA